MHESMSDDSCNILMGWMLERCIVTRRDAFKQINGISSCAVDYSSKSVEYLADYPESSLNSAGQLKIHLWWKSKDWNIVLVI